MDRDKIKAKVDEWLTGSLAPKGGQSGPCVILLSFDALGAQDFGLLKQLPHFNKLLSKGSFSKNLRSVYPSLTYPAHASVLTGRQPRKHGVISNTKLQPTRVKPDWYWKHKEIHGKTFYSEARQQQIQVASILWPVSCGAPVAYNMPEVLPNRPWHNQMSISMLSGSKRYQYLMNERHGHLRKGLEQPHLDEFAHAAALDTLKNFKPQLLMVHYTDLDTQKHNFGAESPEAREAVKRMDQRIGDYLKAIRQLGMEEETTLIIFGDHGSKDVHTAIRPNVILQKEGFLSVEDNGRLHHCDFIFKSCDGSAYLYHDNLHRVSRDLLRQELEVIKAALVKYDEEIGGIKEMRTGAEAGFEGADAHALLMLEAEPGYYFLDDYSGELSEAVPPEKVGTDHWLKATHGYHPDTPDYQSVFFAFGRGVTPREIEAASLVDLGPTVAKCLGMSLGEVDGQPLL